MLLELIIPTLIVRAVVVRVVLAHTLIELVSASRDKFLRVSDVDAANSLEVDLASAAASASAASAACAALSSSEFAAYTASQADEVDDPLTEYERV